MRTRAIAISSTVCALVLATALPASAETSGPTGATLTVAGGSIAITVPTNVNLGTWTSKIGGGDLSEQLGSVTVNDERNGTAGWVASVISTAWTPSAGPTIAASLVDYSSGTIVGVGTATYADGDPKNLTGPKPAVTATAVAGNNSATWNPTITVHMPGNIANGVYTATITHSVV